MTDLNHNARGVQCRTMGNAPLEIVIKQLLRDKAEAPKVDWWARAQVISGIPSSVVIAVIGLAISSALQKAQIASSESSARGQLEIAKLKNEDDKQLQQEKLATDLL